MKDFGKGKFPVYTSSEPLNMLLNDGHHDKKYITELLKKLT